MLSPRPEPVPAPAFTGPARRLLWTLTSRPGLVVVSGHPESSRLSHYFLAAPLLRGEAVLFLDAANCFNPYRLVAFANQCRRPPREFLERVRVSRAFTCFQLAELVERTPAAARRFRTRRIVLTGVPDIFDDEELAPTEAKNVFRRALEQLRRWPQQKLTALVFSDAPSRPSPLGEWLRRALAQPATAVYRLEETPAGLCLVGKQPSWATRRKPDHKLLASASCHSERSPSTIARDGERKSNREESRSRGRLHFVQHDK